MDLINVKDAPYNAVGNGIANDTMAVQSALATALSQKKPLYFPSGTYYVTATLDADVDTGLRMFGDHKNFSIIRTDANIELLKVRHEAKVEHLTFLQSSLTNQGKGISVTHGASRGEFRSLEITGFEYGIQGLRTLWLTFSDIEFKSNRIGIQLGYTDPPSTWNNPTGWFNNVINFFNVLVHHGEVGFDLYGMGMTLIGCTTQALSEKGVSIQGPASDNSTFNNVIINHYAEDVPKVLSIKNSRETVIKGLFAQGDDDPDPHLYAILEAINSNVSIEGSTGQAGWQYNAVLTNSVLKGVIEAAAGRYSVDQTSLHKANYSFKLNHVTANNGWHNLLPPFGGYEMRPPIWLLPRHTYRIILAGIRDGFDPCVSEYLLYHFDITKYLLKPITVTHIQARVIANPYSAEVGNIIQVRLDTTTGGGLSSAWAHIKVL